MTKQEGNKVQIGDIIIVERQSSTRYERSYDEGEFIPREYYFEDVKTLEGYRFEVEDVVFQDEATELFLIPAEIMPENVITASKNIGVFFEDAHYSIKKPPTRTSKSNKIKDLEKALKFKTLPRYAKIILEKELGKLTK